MLVIVDDLKISNLFYSNEFIEITIEHNMQNVFEYLICKIKNTDFIYKEYYDDDDDYINEITQLEKSEIYCEQIYNIIKLTIDFNRTNFLIYILDNVDFSFDTILDVSFLNKAIQNKRYNQIEPYLKSPKFSNFIKCDIIKLVASSIQLNDMFKNIIEDDTIFNNKIIDQYKFFEIYHNIIRYDRKCIGFSKIYEYNTKFNIIDNSVILRDIIHLDNLKIFKEYHIYNALDLKTALSICLLSENVDIFEYLLNNFTLTSELITLILNDSSRKSQIVQIILESTKIPDSTELDLYIKDIFEIYNKDTSKKNIFLTKRKINIKENINNILLNCNVSLFQVMINNSGFSCCDEINDILFEKFIINIDMLLMYYNKYPNLKLKLSNLEYIEYNSRILNFILRNKLIEDQVNKLEYIFKNNITNITNLEIIINTFGFNYTKSIIDDINKILTYPNISNTNKKFYLDLLKKARIQKIENICK